MKYLQSLILVVLMIFTTSLLAADVHNQPRSASDHALKENKSMRIDKTAAGDNPSTKGEKAEDYECQ
jgi:hypothetical protein